MALSGSASARAHDLAPDQPMQQAVREIVEIVEPLAQIRIGLPEDAGAIVALHALDRGLGGQAGEHGLPHAPEPSLVVGEHAEGLEHLAMLAVMGDVAAHDQFVDRGAHLGDGLFEAFDLGLQVLGDQVLHDHAGLVQHDVTQADAVGERGAVQRTGRRNTISAAPGAPGACSSPEAIISASTIAVVWSASISSSA